MVLQVPIDSQACDRRREGGSPTVFCLGVGIQMIIGSLDHRSLSGLLFGLGLTCLGVFFLKLELESIQRPDSDVLEKDALWKTHDRSDPPRNLVQRIMKDLDTSKPSKFTFSYNTHTTRNNTEEKTDERGSRRCKTEITPIRRFSEPPPHHEHPDIPSSFGPAAKNMPNWTKNPKTDNMPN